MQNKAGRDIEGYVPIATTTIARNALFPHGIDTPPDCDALLGHLQREGRLSISDALLIIESTVDLFKREANVVRIEDPVTISGDIHGQFYDLPEIFKMSKGVLPGHKYLFLGDYVDRGSFGSEILFYLFALKLAYPKSVFLIRGNHESRQMSEFFNFRDECRYKYSEADDACRVYEAFIDSFQAMPLAAIVNSKYLCVHGGISPDLHTVSQLYLIDRFVEPPSEGLLCDLLWSDPDSDAVSAPAGFRHNSSRGCSYMYSHDSVCEFLNTNGLRGLIRAHEVQAEGFLAFPKNLTTNFPSVISVFSAPNYCDLYGNKGAVLNLVDDHMDIVQFLSQPHPFHLPNFMDAFAWSVPFVCENLSELLHAIETSLDTMEIPLEARPASTNRPHSFRSRAQAVGRMLGLMKHVRDKTPPPLDRSNSPEVAEESETFMAIARSDSFTERSRPGTFVQSTLI